jgi:hypothetical protein
MAMVTIGAVFAAAAFAVLPAAVGLRRRGDYAAGGDQRGGGQCDA